MKKLFVRLFVQDEGQDLIEYALLAAFVSLVAAGGATILGGSLNTWYTKVGGTVGTMATGP